MIDEYIYVDRKDDKFAQNAFAYSCGDLMIYISQPVGSERPQIRFFKLEAEKSKRHELSRAPGIRFGSDIGYMIELPVSATADNNPDAFNSDLVKAAIDFVELNKPMLRLIWSGYVYVYDFINWLMDELNWEVLMEQINWNFKGSDGSVLKCSNMFELHTWAKQHGIY